MRPFAVFGVIALALFASAEDLKKVAESHEAAFRKAIMTKDMKWFEEVAAPDYHEVMRSGKRTTRAESISMMKQSFGMFKVKSITTKVKKVTPSGNGMKVLIDCHMVASMPNPQTKKNSTMESQMSYQETWSKVKGKWMIHELKSLTSITKMDGKVIPGGM